MSCRRGIPLLVALVVACTPTDESAGSCEEVLAEAAWVGGTAPEFVELWRAGGAREGEDLAVPIWAAVAPDGRLAITDMELGEIGVGPDGEWLGSLTRPGDGPGETRMPVVAAWTAEGRLTVLDIAAGKVLLLEPGEALPDGLISETPLDPTTFGPIMQGGQSAGAALAPDGTTYLQSNFPDPSTFVVTQTLFRLGADGSSDTVFVVTAPSMGGDWRPALTLVAPGFPRLVFAAAADGRLALAGDSGEYVIRILSDAAEERLLCRSVAGLPLRPDEFGADIDPDNPFRIGIEAAPRPTGGAPIGRLLFGRQGRLWVERDRPFMGNPFEFLAGRPGSLYDVFGADGGYLGEIRAPDNARIVAASGDRVWAFETGAFDVTWIVAYRLERASP
jgi:hypothetical protein